MVTMREDPVSRLASAQNPSYRQEDHRQSYGTTLQLLPFQQKFSAESCQQNSNTFQYRVVYLFIYELWLILFVNLKTKDLKISNYPS